MAASAIKLLTAEALDVRKTRQSLRMSTEQLKGSSRFRVLGGLPTAGPLPKWLPEPWSRSGREGFVVRFTKSDGATWVGNFSPGLGGTSRAIRHPDGRRVVVVAEGAGYVVDPDSEGVDAELPGSVSMVWTLELGPDLLIDRQGVAFYRLGPRGILWHTRRLSWDGFRGVEVTDRGVSGEAWSPIDDTFHHFDVDLASGVSTGGAPGAYVEGWERLARP